MFALWLVGMAGWAGQASGQVHGTATYRERLALPLEAVFEATLEDVSQADAPAAVIGQARIARPGNPPIRFEITYHINIKEVDSDTDVRLWVPVPQDALD